MMEELFKAKEGDRGQQIRKLRFEIDQHKQNLLKFDQQRFISGELEADSYQRLKAHALGELDRMNLLIADLEIIDTAFQKYTRYGMSLLKDLTWYFQEARLEAKRKLLGSIFPAKLTFQDGKYRTDGLNPVLAIILQKTKNLENEKCGDISVSENVSGDVLGAGLEPPRYCYQGILRPLNGISGYRLLQQL
ncbi:MAG: hypothetical protein HYZ48_01165 [Chlamydiales bacterium]|nr:hypothetical protein [Chlamydiales bacterium]